MRFLILPLTFLSLSIQADEAIRLGTINSKQERLGERFTYKTSDQDRLKSLGSFYQDKSQDFLGQVSGSKVEGISHSDVKNAWSDLLGSGL